MARGDYIEVTYRTGGGSYPHKVQAKSVGSTVVVDVPKNKNDAFVTVRVQDKNGNELETARFAVTEVIAIIEGHEMLKR